MASISIDLGSRGGYVIPDAEQVALEYFARLRRESRLFYHLETDHADDDAQPDRLTEREFRRLDAAIGRDIYEDRYEGLLERRSFPALAALPLDWDLSEFDDACWEERSPFLLAAVEEIWGRGRSAYAACGLLSLKRKLLFPLLGYAVPWTLGWGRTQPVAPLELLLLVGQFRKAACMNRDDLDEIDEVLSEGSYGGARTRLRVLGAVLWSLAELDRPHSSLADWAAECRRAVGPEEA